MKALINVLRDIQKDLHVIASLMLSSRMATEKKFNREGEFENFLKSHDTNE